VHPRAQFEPERPHGVADGEPAAHAACRPVEQRQEPISRRRDLATAEVRDLPPQERVELSPRFVSLLAGCGGILGSVCGGLLLFRRQR